MAELKLCPFCGEKPRFVEKDPFEHHRKEFYVYGVYCDCGVCVWKNTAEEAIEIWNRRCDNG